MRDGCCWYMMSLMFVCMDLHQESLSSLQRRCPIHHRRKWWTKQQISDFYKLDLQSFSRKTGLCFSRPWGKYSQIFTKRVFLQKRLLPLICILNSLHLIILFCCNSSGGVICLFRFYEKLLLFTLDLIHLGGRGACPVSVGFWVGDCSNRSSKNCVTTPPGLTSGLSWRWLSNKLGQIPGYESRSIQSGMSAMCPNQIRSSPEDPSTKPTLFEGHHLDSQRLNDDMRVYMSSLVRSGRKLWICICTHLLYIEFCDLQPVAFNINYVDRGWIDLGGSRANGGVGLWHPISPIHWELCI